MKKDETNSWGGRGLKPFVVSTCNCLNAVSSRGVPRLIAGTWRVFQGRATWPLALFLVLFSYALLFGTFGLGLCGPSYPGLFWVRYGQCCWSIDTFELVIKGEREHPSVKYPVSPTWPSARRLWPLLRCWQSPRGRCRRGSYVPRVSTDGLEKL